MIRAFIQARMSSNRFPGKVLAPFKNEPVILHVLRAAWQVFDKSEVVVLTSTQTSDDPVVAYLHTLAVPVFRGSLDNVFERFCQGLHQFPCEWVMRLNADSPLLDPLVLEKVKQYAETGTYDLVTTTFPRTFPKGQNAELIRTAVLLGIDRSLLTPHDQEHVTPYFYRNPDQFQIFNVTSSDPGLAEFSLAIDTLDDLRRLEAWKDRKQLPDIRT